MKFVLRTAYFCLSTVLGGLFLVAQAQSYPELPNGDLEDWTSVGPYENPTQWTSLNILTSVFAPVTVTKTTDSYEGMYAARLETQDFFGNIIPGIIYLGTFDTGLGINGLIAGVPFAGGLPAGLSGYYKYTSVNNDSAAVVAQLWGINPASGQRDTIAEATVVFYQSSNQYAPFDIPFVYMSGVVPDSINVVATSSAGGADFLGVGGSTLYIDGLNLHYESAIAMPNANNISPNLQAQNGYLQLANFQNLPNNTGAKLYIYAQNGQQIAQFVLNDNNIANRQWPLKLKTGMYLWQLSSNNPNGIVASGRFWVKE